MKTHIRFVLAVALVGCGGAGTGDDAGNGPDGGKADDAEDAGPIEIDGDDPIAQWLTHGAQWAEDGTFAIAGDVCFKATDEGPRFAAGTCEDLAGRGWEGAEQVMDGQTIKATGLAYLDMLRQISFAQGCTDDGIDSYVIADQLVEDGSFPRVVNTLCSKDTKNRQNAYFALSFATEDGEDISTTSLEMFAWDSEEERYRFYKSEGEEGARELEIEAEECEGCHLTPDGLNGVGMQMTPVMNELERPWQHWHSSTNFGFELPDHLDFVNNSGEDFMAEMAERAPAFAKLATPWSNLDGESDSILKSARVLEATINSGYDRVARTRVEMARDEEVEASLGEAMGLLRPMFCDEQVNYVSQDSEQVVRSAVVPNAIEDRLRGLRIKPPLDWFLSDAMTLPSETQAGGKLQMVPARGHAPQAVEDRIMVRRLLSASDDRSTAKKESNTRGLQTHAIDWQHTVLSNFRCGLWQHAMKTMEGLVQAGAEEIELSDGETLKFEGKTTAQLLPRLFEEVTTIRPGDFGFELDAPVRFATDGSKLVVLRTPSQANIDLLAEGSVPECSDDEEAEICLATPELFAEMIETLWDGVETGGAAAFEDLRNERLCHIEDLQFGAVPDFGPAPDCGGESEGEPENDGDGDGSDGGDGG